MKNLETMKKISREIAKRRLWVLGYKVKDVSKIMPFDLLVDGKYKVDVRYLNFFPNKKVYRADNLSNLYSDIVVFVSLDKNNNHKFYYIKSILKNGNGGIITEELVNAFSENHRDVFSGTIKKISFIPRKLKLEKDEWYSLREVSQLLSYPGSVVKALIKKNKLKAILAGDGVKTRYKIKGEWVEKFIEKNFTK